MPTADIRAAPRPGRDDVDLLYAAEPLVLWHQDEDRPRISLASPWEAQLEWLKRSRDLLTPRAYAAVLMSVISSMAAPTRSTKVLAELLREARRHGRPGVIEYLTFTQIWLIPPRLRHTLRDKVLSRRRGTAGANPQDAHGPIPAELPDAPVDAALTRAGRDASR
ncbi:hypothetical protein JNW88_20730 [Micromonospora sp. ATA32]|nr:hypothetical protein [Micromonospora sp. ATA32]